MEAFTAGQNVAEIKMSKISEQEVRKIAHLARLELGEEEVSRFTGQLENILEYVESLNEVDVEGVEPFISAAEAGNVLREDEVRESLPREAALSNAPRQSGGFFQVPAVV